MTRGKGKPRWKSAALIAGGLVVAIVAIFVMYHRSSTEMLLSSTGFSIQYPRSWVLDTSKADHTVVREEQSHATVAVDVVQDERLSDASGRTALSREIERDFMRDGAYNTDVFGWAVPDRGAATNGYI